MLINQGMQHIIQISLKLKSVLYMTRTCLQILGILILLFLCNY